MAIKWLQWLSENLEIRHYLNGGEVKIGPFKLDGLSGNTIYECYGCYLFVILNEPLNPRNGNHLKC